MAVVSRQLPAESKLFAVVDKTWKDIMRRTEDRPNALKSATASGVLESLQAANTNLEKIQKCLEVSAHASFLTTDTKIFKNFKIFNNFDPYSVSALIE